MYVSCKWFLTAVVHWAKKMVPIVTIWQPIEAKFMQISNKAN